VVEMPKVEEPTETLAPEPIKAAESAIVTEAEPVSSETPVTLNEPESTSSPKTKSPLTEKKSLNDLLAGSVFKFGLNDRIGFVKELFDGSQEDFNRVVSQLNTCSSLEEATDYINAHISDEYGWDQKEETAARFMTAVEQKFT